MGLLRNAGKLLRGLFPRKRRSVLSDYARSVPLHQERVCSLFDFFEFTAAQRAGIVFSSLDSIHREKLFTLVNPSALHQIVREHMARRRVDEALEDMILKDFLGLELTGNTTPCLSATRQFLHQLFHKQAEMVALDLAEMVLNDREAVSVENLDYQRFFLDLHPGHKVALVLWLTDSLRCPQATKNEEMRVVSQLKLRTKLRVLREFLGLDLSRRPQPDSAEEFGGLALALNKVKEKDPQAFRAKLLEQWPENH